MAGVFTQIIKGELPSYKVMENDWVYAFLALDQIQLGHTLIIPKVEVDEFVDLPEPYYLAIFQAAKPVAAAIKKASGCKRVGTMFVGFEVPHCHYHLVPLWSQEDMSFSKACRRPEKEMIEIQNKIVECL